MSIWDGFASVEPQEFTIKDWARDVSSGLTNANGEEVRWWEEPELGITLTPSNCSGASCQEMTSCADADCSTCGGTSPGCDDGLCVSEIPDAVTFLPRWIYKKHSCHPAGRDPQKLYDDLVASLDVLGWRQVARLFHEGLQEHATVLPNGPASACQGIGYLMRNRGTLGLHAGTLVAPSVLTPTLTAQGLLSIGPGGRPVGPGNIPIVIDNSMPTTGPGGVAATPGSAYAYIIDQPPIVAFRNEEEPGEGFRWDNPADRKKFYDGCCCFEPVVKRRAIAAFNPCAAFAIEIETSC